ncbi:MADS-box transcription factor 23 [Striga asiatica]|uniref:MADS-box transcription factor 23 n=1 Tax=Striga asiatica TaxID=4170 RepID=A0A5A7NZ73_STRAF|nr:MADS-box transcription factor 23 [Striga asiatica]
MEQILSRYNQNNEGPELATVEHSPIQNDSAEISALKDEIERLQSINRKMMGKELEGLNYNDLHNLEQQLTEGILSVKDKKEKVLLEQLEKSKLQIEELRHHARLSSSENRLQIGKDTSSSSLSEKEGTSDTSLRLGFSSVDLSGKTKVAKLEPVDDRKNAMIMD